MGSYMEEAGRWPKPGPSWKNWRQRSLLKLEDCIALGLDNPSGEFTAHLRRAHLFAEQDVVSQLIAAVTPDIKAQASRIIRESIPGWNQAEIESTEEYEENDYVWKRVVELTIRDRLLADEQLVYCDAVAAIRAGSLAPKEFEGQYYVNPSSLSTGIQCVTSSMLRLRRR